ncbi:hypothetical protein U1Q18_023059, partial [Sarracenia purpurea var. burkii]
GSGGEGAAARSRVAPAEEKGGKRGEGEEGAAPAEDAAVRERGGGEGEGRRLKEKKKEEK